MTKERITKTLTLDCEVAKAIESMARHERRSFSKQVELVLEKALKKKSQKVQIDSND